MYLIKRYGKVFVHVGIYINENQIYHYTTKDDNVLKGNHIIKCSNLVGFSLDGKVFYDYINNVEMDVLIHRINEFPGIRKPYNILTNNCITFVLYCLHGKSVTIKEMLYFALQHKVMLFSFLTPIR